MRAGALTLAGTLVLPLILAGCLSGLPFGASDDAYDPLDYEPTGRTIRLRAFVNDVTHEVWPGFDGRFWGFCFQGLDEVSKSVIEYQSHGEPCSTPGPTLRVKQGDKLVIEFTNGHRFPHTIHWHGQVLPYRQDGVPGATQDTVVTGDKYVYEYIAARPGTLIYHCHVDTQRHMFMGLYGTIIVEPQDERFEPEVDKDYTFVFSHGNRTLMDARAPAKDPKQSGQPGNQNDRFDAKPDIFMLNGKSFPNTMKDPASRIDVKEGDRVRIRFVNAGNLPEAIHLHGHDMLVTHKDGLPLPQPYWADTVPILPAERYDVLVVANNPGNWVIHTHVNDHVSNAGVYPGGMKTHFLYEGFEPHPYKAEKAATPVPPPPARGNGTGNATPAPAAPADFEEVHEDAVTSANHAKEYAFTAKPAPAKEVRAKLEWSSIVPASSATLTLVSPSGKEQQATAGANGATVNAVFTDPEPGEYTARVTASGVSASYVLTLTVDYLGND